MCNLHGEDSLPGEAAEAQGRRCTAKTAAGTRCQSWAMHKGVPPLCNVHAGLTAPAAGDSRRCSAKRTDARRGRTCRQCRRWAMVGSNPPLCTRHGGKFLPEERQEAAKMTGVSGGRRCTAVKAGGELCRNWASRNWAISNKPEGPARVGPALCSTHAGRSRLPGQEDEAAGRRCSAVTRAGKRCPNWAKLYSIKMHGRPL